MSDRSAGLPLPPRELAARVYSVDWSDPDAAYLELGAQTRQQIVDDAPRRLVVRGQARARLRLGRRAHPAPLRRRGRDRGVLGLRHRRPQHRWIGRPVPAVPRCSPRPRSPWSTGASTSSTPSPSSPTSPTTRRPGCSSCTACSSRGLLIATFMGRWTLRVVRQGASVEAAWAGTCSTTIATGTAAAPRCDVRVVAAGALGAGVRGRGHRPGVADYSWACSASDDVVAGSRTRWTGPRTIRARCSRWNAVHRWRQTTARTAGHGARRPPGGRKRQPRARARTRPARRRRGSHRHRPPRARAGTRRRRRAPRGRRSAGAAARGSCGGRPAARW